MGPERGTHRNGRETCPWCSEPIEEGADVMVIRPAQATSLVGVLHPECASEWEVFITRAREIAANGSRYPLLVAPLENAVHLESSVQSS